MASFQQLAVLGGQPRFSKPVAFVKPWMPQWEAVKEEIAGCVSSGYLTKGPHLARFEAAIAAHTGAKHAVCVSSCTTGLMLAYKGLGLKGEAIVPSFTFMATISALRWCGVEPVYVDVEFGSTNIDVSLIEAKITPKTSAIVAVHNFGTAANIEPLTALAKKHGLKLVFDSAHGFGTQYRGQAVGAAGDAHSFSMSPTKLLVAGEGGAVTTNDDTLADYLRKGREYGNDGTYDSAFAGMNARMPEINAILGLHSLQHLEQTAAFRNALAAGYRQTLGDLPGIEFQTVDSRDRSSYKDLSIVIDADRFGLSRDQVKRCLHAEGIDTRCYYDPACHQQTAYKEFARGDHELPNTVALAARSLSLPIGEQVTPEIIQGVSDVMHALHAQADAVQGRAALATG